MRTCKEKERRFYYEYNGHCNREETGKTKGYMEINHDGNAFSNRVYIDVPGIFRPSFY